MEIIESGYRHVCLQHQGLNGGCSVHGNPGDPILNQECQVTCQTCQELKQIAGTVVFKRYLSLIYKDLMNLMLS